MTFQRAVRGRIGFVQDFGELFLVGDLEYESNRARQTDQRLPQLRVGGRHDAARLLLSVHDCSGGVRGGA